MKIQIILHLFSLIIIEQKYIYIHIKSIYIDVIVYLFLAKKFEVLKNLFLIITKEIILIIVYNTFILKYYWIIVVISLKINI